MPRTVLGPQQIGRSGIVPSYTAANALGHSVDNDNRTFLHVKTGGTGVTVTIQTPGVVDGLAIAERTVAIGTNTEKMIGPFPPDAYNQGDGSGIYVDFDQVTTITIAALRL